jgi:predicted Ser/Thr protein kinase
MTAEQFQRVREIFERALDAEPANLDAWLDEHARGDREVRAEVAALLQCNSHAGRFLSEPVADRAADLLTEESALAPGTAIGQYTIEREIGRGGMGHVYLARDERLGRTVALKALPPRITHDEAQRERLRREARAAAALSHPGICTVFALEEQDGDLFIVSEYVEGRTLREEIAERRRPSVSVVYETARELADALASAHDKGITHRDLKPENIMRTAGGRVKILDFGLARFLGAGEASATRHVTQPGALIGTPAYMAPEQLNGLPADARADVFAFGVVVYEYACGEHPFDASSAMGIAARVLQSDVAPLEEHYPALPPSLLGVVQRCLQKAPSERFQSAAEIVTALTKGFAVPRRRAVAWWRRHQLIVIGLYLLASVLGWQIKEWQHGLTDPIFLVIGVAATAGAIFRGHLMFTERMNSAGFDDERQRARPITMGLDLLIAALLVADGIGVAGARPLVGVLTFALAVGVALQSLVVEPATTSAAFQART